MQALYPQKGWIVHSPGFGPAELRKTLRSLAAWAEGSAPRDASLSYALAGTGKPAPLRDLMQVRSACLALVHSTQGDLCWWIGAVPLLFGVSDMHCPLSDVFNVNDLQSPLPLPGLPWGFASLMLGFAMQCITQANLFTTTPPVPSQKPVISRHWCIDVHQCTGKCPQQRCCCYPRALTAKILVISSDCV